MGCDPRTNHGRKPDKAENHSQRMVIVRSQNDVVHVPLESGQDHQRDVDGDESEPAEHHQEVDGACALSSAEYARKPRKMVHHGRRHRGARENRYGSEYKDDEKIRQLLQRVIGIESVGFGWKMEVRIVDEGAPRLRQHGPGVGTSLAHCPDTKSNGIKIRPVMMNPYTSMKCQERATPTVWR